MSGQAEGAAVVGIVVPGRGQAAVDLAGGMSPALRGARFGVPLGGVAYLVARELRTLAACQGRQPLHEQTGGAAAAMLRRLGGGQGVWRIWSLWRAQSRSVGGALCCGRARRDAHYGREDVGGARGGGVNQAGSISGNNAILEGTLGAFNALPAPAMCQRQPGRLMVGWWWAGSLVVRARYGCGIAVVPCLV